MDSGASHNLTSDLNNLSIHSEYNGTDEVQIADGSGLHISHIGSATISHPSRNLLLSNVLCVPSAQRNLLYVHEFTKENNVFIEFHPWKFVVKDQESGEKLLQGKCDQGIYQLGLPVKAYSRPVAHMGVRASTTCWHNRLGHPNSSLCSSIIHSFQLPIYSDSSRKQLSCISCYINKSQQLPFRETSLVSSSCLEFIYADVWGPTRMVSIDGYRYYLILVDHFIKYVWLYPMHQKSQVADIFPLFKVLVEKQFGTKIKNFYSDNGDEFMALKRYLSSHGISWYTSAPYTPQQNGTAERRHRQIVAMGRALLHHAYLSCQFWSYAMETATYLYNRLPSTALQGHSPFEMLFKKIPNYEKLRIFGCLCFPWLKPYSEHKLQPPSRECLFLGYALGQSAYRCYDLINKRMFISRNVRFDEFSFPGKSFFFNDESNLSTPVRTSADDLISPVFIGKVSHEDGSHEKSYPTPTSKLVTSKDNTPSSLHY